MLAAAAGVSSNSRNRSRQLRPDVGHLAGEPAVGAGRHEHHLPCAAPAQVLTTGVTGQGGERPQDRGGSPVDHGYIGVEPGLVEPHVQRRALAQH
jgi:hypothetical protein